MNDICPHEAAVSRSQPSPPLNMVQERNTSAAGRTMVISRAAQLTCVACTYKVFVNGQDLGSVGAGGSVSVQVFSNTATVDICCTTVMMGGYQFHTTLKVFQNPRIDFRIEWPGAIHATVNGAEILA